MIAEEIERYRTVLDTLWDVLQERKRQNAKWGQQNHDPAIWLAILTEEAGEVAQAICKTQGDPVDVDHDQWREWRERLRQELIEVAAVAVAAIECCDRNNWISAGDDNAPAR